MKQTSKIIFGALSVALVTSQAYAAPTLKTRTFDVELKPSPNLRPGMAAMAEVAKQQQTVYFDQATSTLVLCENGLATACRRSNLDATDVIPYKDGVLVLETTRSAKFCNVQSAGINCKSLLLADLGVSDMAVEQRVKAIGHSGMYTPLYGILFSSANQLRPGGLLFGNFTGKSLQVLDIRTSTICDIGGSCREAQGLEAARAASTIGSAQAVDPTSDRAHLLAVEAHSLAACVAYHDSPTAVGFHCQTEMTEVHAGAELFIVQNSAGYSNVVEAQSPTARVPWQPKTTDVNVGKSLKALALTASRNAGLTLSAEAQPGRVTPMATGGPTRNPGQNASYLWSEATTWTEISQGDVLWTDTHWSDDWGVEYNDGWVGLEYAFATNLPHETKSACEARVDAMYAARQAQCNVNNVTYQTDGIVIAAGATIIGAVAGKVPGALVGLTIGAIIGTTYTGFMTASCAGQAAGTWLSDRAGCE